MSVREKCEFLCFGNRCSVCQSRRHSRAPSCFTHRETFSGAQKPEREKASALLSQSFVHRLTSWLFETSGCGTSRNWVQRLVAISETVSSLCHSKLSELSFLSIQITSSSLIVIRGGFGTALCMSLCERICRRFSRHVLVVCLGSGSFWFSSFQKNVAFFSKASMSLSRAIFLRPVSLWRETTCYLLYRKKYNTMYIGLITFSVFKDSQLLMTLPKQLFS